MRHANLYATPNQVLIHSPPKEWKLRDHQMCSRFQEVFKAYVLTVETEAAITIDEIWTKLNTGVLMTIDEVCDTTKTLRWRNETWWWNKDVPRCHHRQAQSL